MASKPVHNDDSGRLIVPNLIGGKPVILLGSASFPITSARQQEVVHYGQTASLQVVAQAAQAAAETFKTYKRTPIHQRRSLLLRAAELFREKAEEAKRRQMVETSCDEQWANFTGSQTPIFCEETASAIAAACTGEIPPSYFGYTQLVYREPVGPVLIIPPWNAAVILSARGIANALAAGCTVVVKASELCPWTHQFVVETFHEAGFPPGAINMIMADRPAGAEVTESIIANPAIRKVEFIGSAGVGRIIGSVAAKHLKPILMELGDQSPAIILDDADLENAAKLCARGAMIHHGQVCFSTERIIVQSGVKEEFTKLLQAAVEEMAPEMVAVSNSHAEKAKKVVDEAIRDGAELVYGTSEMLGPASTSPSILTNVNPKSSISTAEAFAPTAFIIAVDSDEQAIQEANSRIGGLSAAVFTANHERGLKMSRELEFGSVQINNMTIFAEPAGPLAGFKGSGWGSNNGRYGISAFLFDKAVSFVPTGTSLNH